jgi:hypothetical protein
MREFLAKFGDDLPQEINDQLDAFEQRLGYFPRNFGSDGGG